MLTMVQNHHCNLVKQLQGFVFKIALFLRDFVSLRLGDLNSRSQCRVNLSRATFLFCWLGSNLDKAKVQSCSTYQKKTRVIFFFCQRQKFWSLNNLMLEEKPLKHFKIFDNLIQYTRQAYYPMQKIEESVVIAVSLVIISQPDFIAVFKLSTNCYVWK